MTIPSKKSSSGLIIETRSPTANTLLPRRSIPCPLVEAAFMAIGPRMALGAGFRAASKARVRSCSYVWFACISFAIGAWIGTPAPATAQQQASGPAVKPEVQRVQPKRGRDNDYTPQQMAERLIAWAEGPIPSRESLEREFGFEFAFRSDWRGSLSYVGLAGKPFAQATLPDVEAANIRYSETKDGTFRYLELDFLKHPYERTSSMLCVENFAVSKPLQARGWVRMERVRGHRLDVTYTAEINRVHRTVRLVRDWALENRCLDRFYIDYRQKSNLDGAPK